MISREKLIKDVSAAMSEGKDSGGYETLFDMLSHIALKVIAEECAKVAEAQAQDFLSPEYATNQPFGSLCERFACDEVAKAIRSLTMSPAIQTPIENKGSSQSS